MILELPDAAAGTKTTATAASVAADILRIFDMTPESVAVGTDGNEKFNACAALIFSALEASTQT